MLARDVMSPLAVCLRETDTIDEAARFFLQSGISSTPVLDADGRLAGFLSEKDLMAAMISPECWQHPLTQRHAAERHLATRKRRRSA